MTDPQLHPQTAYETPADALRCVHDDPEQGPVQALAALRDTVEQVTDIWQRCEALRATRDKEFR